MLRAFQKRSRWAFVGGLSLGLAVGVGMLIGSLAASRNAGSSSLPAELRLNAMGTHGADTFAICTGPIAEGMEGVFLLDFLTGELQCMVPNARTGALGGLYKHNVYADLKVEAGTNKKPQFLMVTGTAQFRSGAVSTTRPAGCILYVADAQSGNWVAYSLPWDSSIASGGGAQGGKFIPIGAGRARELAIRD